MDLLVLLTQVGASPPLAAAESFTPAQLALGLCAGIGLSAAAGFRVFVPLLVLSIGARSGMIPLGDDFAWVTSDFALFIFATATVLEIGSYYIPWVDNLLDTLATPAAMISGTVMTAAVMPEVNPVMQWILATVAGGGTAGAFQLGTVATRAASTATSGGLANPVVSTTEAGGATVISLLALLAPVFAVILLGVIVWLIYRLFFRKNKKPGHPPDKPGV